MDAALWAAGGADTDPWAGLCREDDDSLPTALRRGDHDDSNDWLQRRGCAEQKRQVPGVGPWRAGQHSAVLALLLRKHRRGGLCCRQRRPCAHGRCARRAARDARRGGASRRMPARLCQQAGPSWGAHRRRGVGRARTACAARPPVGDFPLERCQRHRPCRRPRLAHKRDSPVSLTSSRRRNFPFFILSTQRFRLCLCVFVCCVINGGGSFARFSDCVVDVVLLQARVCERRTVERVLGKAIGPEHRLHRRCLFDDKGCCCHSRRGAARRKILAAVKEACGENAQKRGDFFGRCHGVHRRKPFARQRRLKPARKVVDNRVAARALQVWVSDPCDNALSAAFHRRRKVHRFDVQRLRHTARKLQPHPALLRVDAAPVEQHTASVPKALFDQLSHLVLRAQFVLRRAHPPPRLQLPSKRRLPRPRHSAQHNKPTLCRLLLLQPLFPAFAFCGSSHFSHFFPVSAMTTTTTTDDEAVSSSLELSSGAATGRLSDARVAELRRAAECALGRIVPCAAPPALLRAKVVCNARRNFVDVVLCAAAQTLFHAHHGGDVWVCFSAPAAEGETAPLSPVVSVWAVLAGSGAFLRPPLAEAHVSVVERALEEFRKRFGVAGETYLCGCAESEDAKSPPLLLRVRVAAAMLTEKVLPVLRFLDVARLRASLAPIREAFAAAAGCGVTWVEARERFLLAGERSAEQQQQQQQQQQKKSGGSVNETLEVIPGAPGILRDSAVAMLRAHEPLLMHVADVRTNEAGAVEVGISRRFLKPFVWMWHAEKDDGLRFIFYISDKIEPFVIATVADLRNGGSKLARLSAREVDGLEHAIDAFAHTFSAFARGGSPLIQGFHYTPLGERRETDAARVPAGTKSHSSCFHLKLRVCDALFMHFSLALRTIVPLDTLLAAAEPVRYAFGRTLISWPKVRAMLLEEAASLR